MNAIVYTSNTGHTAAYARLVGEKTGLPVYSLKEATKLQKGTAILYLGWLFANNIKGYKQAAKRFHIAAVCAVGLCDTGTAIPDVQKMNALSVSLPLFTLQGGIDKTKLRGINKLMITMLTKAIGSKQDKTDDDKRMLYLLENDHDYVSEDNLTAFLKWYRKEDERHDP